MSISNPNVRPPPAPKIEAVKLDPTKTVLLVMDFNNNTCAEAARPRCAAALPGIHRLLDAARAKGVLVIYTLSGVTTAADISKEVAPLPGERVVPPRTDQLFGRMDKFFDSNLEPTLRARGIDTVLATGTSANGAVLYTVSGAAARKFKVVVPVDGMPADTAYQEQFTAYQFITGPVIRGRIVLTKIDLIILRRQTMSASSILQFVNARLISRGRFGSLDQDYAWPATL